MSKNFIFGLYAVICLVGFGGFMALSWATPTTTPTTNSLNEATAIVGFYGFFCATASFYMFTRFQTAMQTLTDEASERFDDMWRSISRIEDQVDSIVQESKENCCVSYDNSRKTKTISKK